MTVLCNTEQSSSRKSPFPLGEAEGPLEKKAKVPLQVAAWGAFALAGQTLRWTEDDSLSVRVSSGPRVFPNPKIAALIAKN